MKTAVSRVKMRNPSNLPRVRPRDSFDHFRTARRDTSLTFQNEVDPQGDNVAELLRDTMVDLVARERAEDSDADEQDGPSGQAAALHLMQGTVSPESAEFATSIPSWKRVLDLTVICLMSPIWLPVMVLIMLAIRIGSPGPVFYRQQRVGYRGRNFMIFKFRTMKVNVETQIHESHFERLMVSNLPMVKLDAKGDPRLIRFGRFLRAAGLDELPQIFNVWRGEMSLVGPRPCTIHEFEHYEPWQRERVNAPPGLTGFWQVNGKNRTTFSEMIDMDILYGSNMSLRLDLLILLKTIPAVLDQFIESQGGWWSSWTKQQSFSKRTPVFEHSPRL